MAQLVPCPSRTTWRTPLALVDSRRSRALLRARRSARGWGMQNQLTVLHSPENALHLGQLSSIHTSMLHLTTHPCYLPSPALGQPASQHVRVWQASSEGCCWRRRLQAIRHPDYSGRRCHSHASQHDHHDHRRCRRDAHVHLRCPRASDPVQCLRRQRRSHAAARLHAHADTRWCDHHC